MLCSSRRLVLLCAALLCLSVPRCIHTEVELPDAPKSAEEASKSVGNPLLPNRGDFNSVNFNVSTSEELEKYDNGSREELIWTNPDDPNADIPELDQAFMNKRHGSGWQDNFSRAVRLSRQHELPLLIWFHDSLLSRKCKQLASDFMNTKEFDDWCRDRVIRLRLDSGAAVGDSTADSAPYSTEKINALKKFYGLKKKPAVVVISANGRVAARLEGYSGSVQLYAKDIGLAVADAQKAYNAHKDTLRTRGYREWRPRSISRSLFAKLLRVDDTKKIIYLKENGGRVSHFRASDLSQEDTDYLDEMRRKSKKKHASNDSDAHEQI